MDDKARWEAMIWKAGSLLAERLRTQLNDPEARSISLEREEALIALGIIDGAVEAIEKGPPKQR